MTLTYNPSGVKHIKHPLNHYARIQDIDVEEKLSDLKFYDDKKELDWNKHSSLS